jgi:phage baseplate assembly protein W
MNSLEDHVRQSILLILQTAQGERDAARHGRWSAEPGVYPCLLRYRGARVKDDVEEALLHFEPRVDVLGVTVDPRQPGVLVVELTYRVRQTDAIFNLVYPFYLERGER